MKKPRCMSLFNELKRRNVFRVAIAYLAGSWLLIEVAGTLFPVFGLPVWGVRFVVIVLALGFLPALIISWAYELTPEGPKREKDVVRDASIMHLTAKRLDWITIGLIAAALLFIVADRFWMSPRHPEQSAVSVEVVTGSEQTSKPELTEPQYPSNSIAVLSFVNMSSDPEQEYFSDGISEELLNLLAKIPELRVTSRSSAFSFKGKDLNIPMIAAQLHVAYILEGSVRKAGNKVRITAQLIETRSDTHLWSQTYDRELENIFVVQDEISSAIVATLKERLGVEINKVPRVIAAASTEAHNAYLRGRYLLVQRTRAAMKGAIREFEKAIEIDPNFARAHAELAIVTLFSNQSYLGDLPRSEAISRATPHAERAMVLDPNLAEAHATTGMLLFFKKNWEEALAHYQQAIRINPNYAIVYSWMSQILGEQLGRYVESFAAMQTAVRLDPLSIVILRNHIFNLINTNRLVEADRELEKLASISPSWNVFVRAERTSMGGKWANSVQGSLVFLQSVNDSAWSRSILALQLAVIGLDKEALDLAGVSHFGVLRILGRPDEAVKTADRDFARNTVDPRLHRDQELALAGSGDYASARPILEEKWQRSGGRVNCCKQFRIESAAALIAIRRDADEDTGANELLAAIRDNVRRLRGAGMTRARLLVFSVDFEEGLAAYLAGEREKGLALIAKAVEDGYFILPGEAYLQTLYDDPGFASIRAGQEARQTGERKKFLTIVCTDNPYADVWQPAEETCEQIAETVEN